jgi:hypothetical protein
LGTLLQGRASRDLTPSFFAEFLEPLSPASLGLLDQPTSVGSRYGLAKFYPAKGGDSDSFLGRRNLQIAFGLPRRLLERLTVVLPDFPSKTGLPFQREHLYRPAWIIPLRPAPDSNLAKCRNINLLAIGYARLGGPHLRLRLTLRRRTLRRKPWAFGRPDSHRTGATHSGILTSQRSSPPSSEPSPPWERSPTG